jgi:hypothetical protein
MKRGLHRAALQWSCAAFIALRAVDCFGAVTQQTGAESEALPQSAIYLGCGEVDGRGVVLQLDQSGEVLGVASLPGTPYGLALHKGGLLAAVPRGTSGAGSVMRIGGGGTIETLLEDRRIAPHPISIAADAASGDIFVADNVKDAVLVLPGGRARMVRTVLEVEGPLELWQDMAIASDGEHILLGGTRPNEGVYRVSPEPPAALGEPLIPDSAAVAADPMSARWVAALLRELRVFEEEEQLAVLTYPQGYVRSSQAISFGPADGILVCALRLAHTQGSFMVYRVDLKADTFRPLFPWTTSRVVCLAVGPKLEWGGLEPSLFGTEPGAPHEPPPRASVSDAPDDRTLDSLPESGSSGGR